MSATSNYLDNVKKILATRAGCRANMKARDTIKINGLAGEWIVWRVDGDSIHAVRLRNGQPWQGIKTFARTRCTPVSAPELPAA